MESFDLDRIQLAFFFINGFLVSRILIKSKVPERFVYLLLKSGQMSFSMVILALIFVSALLSFIIPNAITVLTLLPVLAIIQQLYQKQGMNMAKVSTVLALSIIYGANIGGMGSITATPANGILVTFTELQNIPNKGSLNYATWLLWGLPLVLVFVTLAWGLLVVSFQTFRSKATMRLSLQEIVIHHGQQKLALYFAAFYFISSLFLSLLVTVLSEYEIWIVSFTSLLSIVFMLFLFLLPLPIQGEDGQRQVLLKIPDCYANLPKRGFLFVGIVIVFGALVYVSGLAELFMGWVEKSMPTDVSIWGLFFIVALITSFATEIFSNTVIQVAMFGMVVALSQSMDVSLLKISVVITLACTSAFMSPIATGVNGLAFGGVEGVSFRRMLAVGLAMNVFGAALISSWVYWFV